MAKVIKLLEKMGLVYAEGGESEATAPEKVATPVAEKVAAPPTRRAAQAEPATPPPAVRRIQTPRLDPALEAVAAEAAAADGSADYPFEQIYTSAGIRAPQHGFTVFKLIEMMQADELRDLDGPTRAKVITGMLRRLPGGPVALEDIVRDAVQRDQALDAFERFLAERTARTEAELGEANRKLQAEVDELVRRNTEAMQANQAKVEAERAKLERWRTRKRGEEERLYTAVQPFVEANPVTVGGIGGEPPAAPGEPTASSS